MALSRSIVNELRVRRMLAEAAGQRRRTRIKKLPEQRWPTAARTAYAAELRSVFVDLADFIEQQWFPKLPAIVAGAKLLRPVTSDAAGDELDRDVFAPEVVVNEVADGFKVAIITKNAAAKVAQFNKQQLNLQFTAGLGFDLLQTEPYLGPHLELFAADNARLVRNISTQAVESLRGLVLQTVRTGGDVDTLRGQIEDQLQLTKKRAALLARDQVGKLDGELTHLRHNAMGVEEYDWHTVGDDLVRPDHRRLDGTRQKWSDPPIVNTRTGFRAHPRGDINCRCNAVPVLSGALAAIAGP